MTQIIPLPDGDFPAYVDILARAYPGIQIEAPDRKAGLAERLRTGHHDDPTMTVFGAYREDALLGGMIYYDFTMQCFEAQVPCGGVGMVAVDLLHKKEKIARDMIRHFLAHYDAQGAPLTALFPFRPDFYRQMGFGYGTKMNQYRVLPAALPRGSSKAHLRYLGAADQVAVQDCYERLMRRTHGLMTRTKGELGRRMFENPQISVVGYEDEAGVLQGYLAFRFKPAATDSFLKNNLIVTELVHHAPEVLAEFFTFLHTQADQINRIVFNTQDEYFHHALQDPRNGCDPVIPSVYHESHVTGVGLMYRVLDVPRLFRALADHDFGGETVTLRIALTDSFLPSNAGSTTVRFEAGRATILPDDARAEVEIALDVAEFSSLALGCVPFRWLRVHGLAAISDEAHLGTVDRVFQTPDKPVCMTDF